MTTLLKNGSEDILIEDGVISAVGDDTEIAASYVDKVIDCTGLTIFPGICDMHVHLRDPGQTHKEDLISGARAAAAGGVTAIMCMPNTTPPIDTPEAVRDIVERSKGLPVKVYPCAAITKGLLGKELSDFQALKDAGAIAVSDDGMPVADSSLMMEAMILADKAGLKVISHCEDLKIADTRISENLMVSREICLSENLRLPVHIAHVSTKEAIGYIKMAKRRQTNVTCEVTPHHFTFTNDKLLKQDADYLMNPPLRGADDVNAIIIGLYNGTVNCIASDHAPHSATEKADFNTAPNGVIGLETMLAATLRLYHTAKIPTLDKVVELLCVNPRKILGIPGGNLKVGSPADLAIVDLNEFWVAQPESFQSKSKNSCFKGRTFKGKVKYTLLNGEVVYMGKDMV